MSDRWLVGVLVVFLCTSWAALCSDALIYFSLDPGGQDEVRQVAEGTHVYVCILDPDENLDLNTRDTIHEGVSIHDPVTGAVLHWDGTHGSFRETGGNTGLFVSSETIAIGGRSLRSPRRGTHTPGSLTSGALGSFDGQSIDFATIGRMENMDTLVAFYSDRNDMTDTALGMLKVIDARSALTWTQDVYSNDRSTASVVVVDIDENLYPNEIEYVPIFIILNPGSWNPSDPHTANDFSGLCRYGGVDDRTAEPLCEAIRWYNIYDNRDNVGIDHTGARRDPRSSSDGRYYIRYPTTPGAVAGTDGFFDVNTSRWHGGIVPVSFLATETGVDTGEFVLTLDSIAGDLGFDSLNIRDVIAAYYLDPNDGDDFSMDFAYIGEMQHSVTNFTTAVRALPEDGAYWLGREGLYVQVLDANANVDPSLPETVSVHVSGVQGGSDWELVEARETTCNSPAFFTFAGTPLRSEWDALGLRSSGMHQLAEGNWRFEASNEETIYVRYNDVYYNPPSPALDPVDMFCGASARDLRPTIARTRVSNDISFDTVRIADTQVFDGEHVQMHFLNRYGDRVETYDLGDAVFIEVIDPDQNEDPNRRERINAYWAGSQEAGFPIEGRGLDIYGNSPAARIIVWNPRNQAWVACDLFETGSDTGVFVSVVPISLSSPYPEVPTLRCLPRDAIFAIYQDPSNLSDTAVISVRVTGD